MAKQNVYEGELKKLNELFQDIDESKKKLAEGLIKSAAFLFAENSELEEILSKTGMVKIHPEHIDLQKNIPAAEQYRKNLGSYSIVIKTLNSILNQNIVDEDDDMNDYE
jgi:regulator of replication initiation timing